MFVFVFVFVSMQRGLDFFLSYECLIRLFIEPGLIWISYLNCSGFLICLASSVILNVYWGGRIRLNLNIYSIYIVRLNSTTL